MIIKQFLLISILAIAYTNSKAQSYEKQYEKCSESLKKMDNVDSVYFELVKKRDSCLVGTIVPNLNVKTIEGKQIELSKLKGSVIVLNFWFTRCQPCIGEMPELNKLVSYYSGKKVEFISFAPEDNATLKAFILKHPFNFDIVPESENIRSEDFKLFSAWPYFIIIDQAGKISKMWFGATENIQLNFVKTIDHLLN